MNRPTHQAFKPGFRLSWFDALILTGGITAACALGSLAWWAGMIVAFVVGHFFLFCNVFRIARKPELIWAAVFTLLTGSTLLTQRPGWTITFVASALVGAVLIAHATRQPSYHGIGWRRINPGLPQWWEQQTGERVQRPPDQDP